MKHKLFSLLILLTALALVGPAVAQDISTKGGISGTIVDTTGAVVPGATVTVTGPIGERVVITDASGNYDVSNLIPGQYTVKASLSGFKTASAPDVTVYVGKSTSVRLTLSTGDITETIEVVGGAVDIDTGNTAIGSNRPGRACTVSGRTRAAGTCRSVAALIRISPGRAISCKRRAMLAVSPITV